MRKRKKYKPAFKLVKNPPRRLTGELTLFNTLTNTARALRWLEPRLAKRSLIDPDDGTFIYMVSLLDSMAKTQATRIKRKLKKGRK